MDVNLKQQDDVAGVACWLSEEVDPGQRSTQYNHYLQVIDENYQAYYEINLRKKLSPL